MWSLSSGELQQTIFIKIQYVATNAALSSFSFPHYISPQASQHHTFRSSRPICLQRSTLGSSAASVSFLRSIPSNPFNTATWIIERQRSSSKIGSADTEPLLASYVLCCPEDRLAHAQPNMESKTYHAPPRATPVVLHMSLSKKRKMPLLPQRRRSSSKCALCLVATLSLVSSVRLI